MKKLFCLLIVIFVTTGYANAAGFPAKPVTHIIPAKAGG
jgi:tripartite-type tricarboxylate transporter receptor subunit TctC